MDENFNNQKQLKSEYNEAGFQSLRLHNLWQTCLRIRGDEDGCDYAKWNWTLDSIWSELVADAKQRDEKKYFMQWKIINLKVKVGSKTNNSFYKALLEKEHFLRCLAEDVGKGGKKTEGSVNYI